ncbi:hypothetical protein SJ780_14190 [Enterococcus faecium]
MSYRVQLIISEDVESQQFGTNVINKVINPALSINAPLTELGRSRPSSIGG